MTCYDGCCRSAAVTLSCMQWSRWRLAAGFWADQVAALATAVALATDPCSLVMARSEKVWLVAAVSVGDTLLLCQGSCCSGWRQPVPKKRLNTSFWTLDVAGIFSVNDIGAFSGFESIVCSRPWPSWRPLERVQGVEAVSVVPVCPSPRS